MAVSDVPEKNLKYGRGQHPNSLKNLRPGYTGQDHSHNGYTLTADLKHTLHEESEFISPFSRPKDKLWREQIKRAILAKSALGDVSMLNSLLNRVDGVIQPELPAGYQDNRQITIIVSNEKTKELMNRAFERLSDGHTTARPPDRPTGETD